MKATRTDGIVRLIAKVKAGEANPPGLLKRESTASLRTSG